MPWLKLISHDHFTRVVRKLHAWLFLKDWFGLGNYRLPSTQDNGVCCEALGSCLTNGASCCTCFWLSFLASCMSLPCHGFIMCTSNEPCMEAAGLRRGNSLSAALTQCLEPSLSFCSQDAALDLLAQRFLHSFLLIIKCLSICLYFLMMPRSCTQCLTLGFV